MNKNLSYRALLVMCVIILLSGCDPIARHKVLTTIFDGVPSLPPPEQLCEEYAEKRIAEVQSQQQKKLSGASVEKSGGSVHAPYEEKLCDDCHDKNTAEGFVVPKKQLCFKCHTNFIKGEYVHGPVAVGYCLGCHEPHSANFPKLLKSGNGTVCAVCHREKRLASVLHEKAAAQHLGCVDCHDPHYGNSPFFLK
jgi:predicted CXXCH cytochrome family protein